MYDALSDGTIRLLRCSWLRSQPAGFVLDRRQDLPPDAFCSDTVAAQLLLHQKRLICALSYGWLTKMHCDPHGLHARKVIDFLNSGAAAHFEAIFWECVL